MALRMGIDLLFHPANFGLTTGAIQSQELCMHELGASGYFLQNALGCFLIAIVAKHKPLLNEHIAVGLSTGLCGSLTTWATWMQLEAFTTLGGEVWMAIVSVVCMLSVSLGSYRLGEIAADCGMGVKPSIPIRVHRRKAVDAADASSEEESGRSGSEGATTSDDAEGVAAAQVHVDWALEICDEAPVREPSAKDPPLRAWLDGLVLAGASVIIVLTVVLLVVYKYDSGLLYMAMAPFGALLRWALSMGNAYTAPLPVFTLVANTLGCAVDAAAAVLAGRNVIGIGHQAWASFGTGFGGCLSTVSTFVAELRSDKLGGFRMRATYFLISLALAMAVMLPTYSLAKC
uniref:Fluoride ion transporter CrcB n=1 Tax=Alexandrium catenella TaxID=2925 RepID=A0A7S1RPP4_ALECA